MASLTPIPTCADTLQEEDVAQLWQACPWGAKLLPTTAGERIQIVYPGRRNLGPGPDFLDAIIALDGRRLRHGHVEVHTTTSAWRAHGHAADPAYHQVILHVVWEDDGPLAGGPLRTLALAPHYPNGLPVTYAAQPLPSFQPCADLHTQCDAMTVGMLFATLGERRLRTKAELMLAAIERHGPEQALYAALLDALGYSQNREPFRLLSEGLPWAVVEPQLEGKANATQWGAALFLGAAGLLPSQRDSSARTGTACRAPTDHEQAYVRTLEALWQQFQLEPVLPASAWVRRGVRPVNAPARRVAAAGILCAQLAAVGPVQAFLALRNDNDRPRELQTLVATLALPASAAPYWAVHCDFGVPLCGAPQSLIGTERAREILVNVLLPFFSAYGAVAGDAALSDWAITLFRRAPAGGMNHLVRAMRDDVFSLPSRYVPMTAARQQGLLHIYHAWCREKRCDACAVGQMLTEPQQNERSSRLGEHAAQPHGAETSAALLRSSGT